MAILILVTLSFAGGSNNQTPGLPDQWSEFGRYHPAANVGSTNDFASLRAEVIAERLRVSFASSDKRPVYQLVTSVDAPGHWPVRDWQTTPMRSTVTGWETLVPVEDLDVPIMYYVTDGRGSVSPMRIVNPRKAGLEEPTRIFWPFIEGFEDGVEGWRTLDQDVALRRDTIAHTGKSALLISFGEDKRSVTIATTRIRGWQVHGQRALGIRFWARRMEGNGRVRVSLLANAFSEKQVIASFPNELKLGPQWQQMDLLFASLPPFSLPLLDLLTMEFIGPGKYLIDDVELLGAWPSEAH